MVAVRQTNHLREIERLTRRTILITTRPIKEVYGTSQAEFRGWNPNKSSLYDVIQNRHPDKVRLQTFFLSE